MTELTVSPVTPMTMEERISRKLAEFETRTTEAERALTTWAVGEGRPTGDAAEGIRYYDKLEKLAWIRLDGRWLPLGIQHREGYDAAQVSVTAKGSSGDCSVIGHYSSTITGPSVELYLPEGSYPLVIADVEAWATTGAGARRADVAVHYSDDDEVYPLFRKSSDKDGDGWDRILSPAGGGCNDGTGGNALWPAGSWTALAPASSDGDKTFTLRYALDFDLSGSNEEAKFRERRLHVFVV